MTAGPTPKKIDVKGKPVAVMYKRRRKTTTDLTGKRFGKLTVIKAKEDFQWLCVCDCGGEIVAHANDLTSRQTISCGCVLKKQLR